MVGFENKSSCWEFFLVCSIFYFQVESKITDPITLEKDLPTVTDNERSEVDILAADCASDNPAGHPHAKSLFQKPQKLNLILKLYENTHLTFSFPLTSQHTPFTLTHTQLTLHIWQNLMKN